MSNQHFIFLTSGQAHSAYFVVNIYTIRKHHPDIPIHAYVWPESFELHSKIAQDKRLGIEVYYREPTYRGKNSQFYDKLLLMRSLPKGTANCYLDSDLTIHGDISELFRQTERYGFTATQFCNWKSNEGLAKNRVSNLIGRDGIPQESVMESLTNPHPSVNGGVFCCQPDSPVLRDWQHWTDIVKEDLFIADETVLHAVCRKWEPPKYLSILRGGCYNQSPMKKFRPDGQKDEDVKIFHHHGDSNLRVDKKGLEGFRRWWPLYQECLELNLGGIREWKNTIGNKYLNRCEQMVEQGELNGTQT